VSLSLPDRWIWDFWLVEQRGEFHLFFLQAPRSLGDPELRHWHVSIGHAVSRDLCHWTLRPDALGPSAGPSWDDYTTWTGSVIRHQDRWHLFYTGTSRAEDGQVQRIGMAVSEDLDRWHRCERPVLEADPRWYEKLGSDWHDEAWRDPWVFQDQDGIFHALITARTRTGARLDRGCVAQARSRDLHHWEVLEPVTSPGGFGQMEVPQIYAAGGCWYLLFCSDEETQSPERRRRGAGTGTFYATAPSPLGPFDTASARPLQADRQGSTYAGRLVDHGGPVFLAWRRADGAGRFVGELADPIGVAVGSAGLHLEGARL
jgi:beta-fructofuranosidase